MWGRVGKGCCSPCRGTVGWARGRGPKNLGKLSFIDLAGSERASDVNDNDRQARPAPLVP